MMLIRHGEAGEERPGMLTEEGTLIDVSTFNEDYDEKFFSSGGIERLSNWFVENEINCPILQTGARLGPPVTRPSKIICVGLNYARHAKESGMRIPREPVLFYKSTTSVIGSNDCIMIPRGSTKTDWEVELAVVIRKKATYIKESDAQQYIAGYMLHNDVSERTFQLDREGQWLKGKGCDTFAPLGPWLVTADAIDDPHYLDLWLKVNGEIMQSGNTSDLIFQIPYLVSYISQFMTLLPGDVISTGTPSGVGMGMNPPRYLKPGDVVELGIEGLGEARQEVIPYNETA